MEINPKHINLDLYDKKQSGIFEIPKLINIIKSSSIVMGEKVNITLEIIPVNETTFKKKIVIEGKVKIIMEEDVQKSDFEFLRDELLKLNKTVAEGFQTVNSRIDNLETTLGTEIKDSEKRVMDYVDQKFDEHVKKYHSK